MFPDLGKRFFPHAAAAGVNRGCCTRPLGDGTHHRVGADLDVR
jgi:hypothetical protein